MKRLISFVLLFVVCVEFKRIIGVYIPLPNMAGIVYVDKKTGNIKMIQTGKNSHKDIIFKDNC